MADIRSVCDSIKGKSGGALVMSLRQAITNSKLYFYGQLLHTPEIAALKGSGENAKYYLLIDNLAFGSYKEFTELPADAQELATPAVRTKIRQLSILTLAANKRRVTYNEIADVVGIKEPRELEDLVIDTITEGLLRGRIDQLQQSIEIFEVAARDVQLNELDAMINKLSTWNQNCTTMTGQLQDSVVKTATHMADADSAAKAMEENEKMIMELAKLQELESREQLMDVDEHRGGFPKRGRDPRGGHGGGDWR